MEQTPKPSDPEAPSIAENSTKQILRTIQQFCGPRAHLTVSRIWVELTGDWAAGVVLSGLIHYSGEATDPDGWFYKTYEDWHREFLLTKNQVGRVVRQFKEAGFLEVKLSKVDGAPVLHYRLLPDRLIEWMDAGGFPGSGGCGNGFLLSRNGFLLSRNGFAGKGKTMTLKEKNNSQDAITTTTNLTNLSGSLTDPPSESSVLKKNIFTTIPPLKVPPKQSDPSPDIGLALEESSFEDTPEPECADQEDTGAQAGCPILDIQTSESEKADLGDVLRLHQAAKGSKRPNRHDRRLMSEWLEAREEEREEVLGALEVFLGDDYWRKSRFPLGAFRAQFSKYLARWRAAQVVEGVETPVELTHSASAEGGVPLPTREVRQGPQKAPERENRFPEQVRLSNGFFMARRWNVGVRFGMAPSWRGCSRTLIL
jgi:hypothetical protein